MPPAAPPAAPPPSLALSLAEANVVNIERIAGRLPTLSVLRNSYSFLADDAERSDAFFSAA